MLTMFACDRVRSNGRASSTSPSEQTAKVSGAEKRGDLRSGLGLSIAAQHGRPDQSANESRRARRLDVAGGHRVRRASRIAHSDG